MVRKISAAAAELLEDVERIKRKGGAKVWTPEQLLVIAVRKELGKSQLAFSELLNVPIGTLRDWEQGRKRPDSAAVTLVKVARSNPEVLEAVNDPPLAGVL